MPKTSGFRSAKQILVASFAAQARACILSDHNIFYSARGERTSAGYNAPGAFLVFIIITPPSRRGLVIPVFFHYYFYWWSLGQVLASFEAGMNSPNLSWHVNITSLKHRSRLGEVPCFRQIIHRTGAPTNVDCPRSRQCLQPSHEPLHPPQTEPEHQTH